MIGIVIGVGIFRVPSEVAKFLPSAELILLAWFLGGIFSLIGAGCYTELSSSFPETGGDYVYLKESYGPFVSFLYGWSSLLVVRTGVIAAIAFIFAEYLLSFLSLDRSLVKISAVAIVLILSFINIMGLREGKRLQNISAIAKVAALAGIIILGVFSGKGDVSNFQPLTVPAGRSLLSLFALALIPILWTYGGWHENTFVTGETQNAKLVLPKALIIGTVIITFLYICTNLFYIYLLPIDRMAGSDLIVSDIMRVLFGTRATKLMEALIIISAFGALNGTIITTSRITYALGRDNPLFRYFGRVDEKHKTPAASIILNAFWSIILIMWGSFNRLLFFTGILVWFFFALIVAGLYILRHKFPDRERPSKVWGYPVTPLVFILVCLWLVVNTAVSYPAESLAGIGLMLSGIPVYIISRKAGRKADAEA